jgi:hypothetical protein
VRGEEIRGDRVDFYIVSARANAQIWNRTQEVLCLVYIIPPP